MRATASVRVFNLIAAEILADECDL
jgi:hypothetical protein